MFTAGSIPRTLFPSEDRGSVVSRRLNAQPKDSRTSQEHPSEERAARTVRTEPGTQTTDSAPWSIRVSSCPESPRRRFSHNFGANRRLEGAAGHGQSACSLRRFNSSSRWSHARSMSGWRGGSTTCTRRFGFSRRRPCAFVLHRRRTRTVDFSAQFGPIEVRDHTRSVASSLVAFARDEQMTIATFVANVLHLLTVKRSRRPVFGQ